ncbi:MAG: hypothetical protein RL226_44 [Bacteroidota bacterium]
MEMNMFILPIAALIPLIVGAIWYNPKVFGNVWMRVADMTEEKIKGSNMAVIFGVTFVLSILLAFMLMPIVIHQMGIFSLFVGIPEFNDVNSEAHQQFVALMTQFDGSFRTFKHGALHGTMAGLFFAMPVIGVNALFERKGFKYIAIHTGFWVVCLALMGGVVCQWV